MNIGMITGTLYDPLYSVKMEDHVIRAQIVSLFMLKLKIVMKALQKRLKKGLILQIMS